MPGDYFSSLVWHLSLFIRVFSPRLLIEDCALRIYPMLHMQYAPTITFLMKTQESGTTYAFKQRLFRPPSRIVVLIYYAKCLPKSSTYVVPSTMTEHMQIGQSLGRCAPRRLDE